jgi:mRNA interferase MazF
MSKDFDRWNEAKKTIDRAKFVKFVHAREVWWCSLGVNVGSEQDGGRDTFERPVLVLRKFNKDTVLIVPLTGSAKRTPYHVAVRHARIDYAAVISQLRLVSTKRLTRLLYQMDPAVYASVVRAVQAMVATEVA